VPLGLAACGDDDSAGDKAATAQAPTPLAIMISDAGSKRFSTQAPATVKGGLVELTFTNAGKAPHEAQLVRIDGSHTPQEAVEIVTDESGAPIPDWFHTVGGAGADPGQAAKVSLNLPAGRYAMIDNANRGEGPSNAKRGALAEFEVTPGKEGALPASTATITAATDEAAKHEGAKHEHSFEVTGLKVGKNRLRFVNKGEEPHHAVMFPMLPGKTIADVEKAFTEERPSGPPPVDFEGATGTAALDGDMEMVTDLVVRKPGKYAMVCFLTDRDGKGKEHLAEGMIAEVDVR